MIVMYNATKIILTVVFWINVFMIVIQFALRSAKLNAKSKVKIFQCLKTILMILLNSNLRS